MSILNIFSSIVSPVTSLFGERGKAKHEEIAADQALEQLETKVEAEENIEVIKGAQAYDIQALQNQIKDWGDDYLLIVMTLPFILGFLPVMQPIVASGWVALQSAPLWYPSILIGITSAKFGLRWLFQKK
jgi:hypothetical protein